MSSWPWYQNRYSWHIEIKLTIDKNNIIINKKISEVKKRITNLTLCDSLFKQHQFKTGVSLEPFHFLKLHVCGFSWKQIVDFHRGVWIRSKIFLEIFNETFQMFLFLWSLKITLITSTELDLKKLNYWLFK